MDADGCSLTCPLSRLAPTEPLRCARSEKPEPGCYSSHENYLLMGASIQTSASAGPDSPPQHSFSSIREKAGTPNW